MVLLLCGDWTLLNVFLAIACDSLDQVDDHDDDFGHEVNVDADGVDINQSCKIIILGV